MSKPQNVKWNHVLLFDKFKTATTKYNPDYNRTQQYATEVKYLKCQPEWITWYFELRERFTEGAWLLTVKTNTELQSLDEWLPWPFSCGTWSISPPDRRNTVLSITIFEPVWFISSFYCCISVTDMCIFIYTQPHTCRAALICLRHTVGREVWYIIPAFSLWVQQCSTFEVYHILHFNNFFLYN
jgi:hypothetical protein